MCCDERWKRPWNCDSSSNFTFGIFSWTTVRTLLDTVEWARRIFSLSSMHSAKETEKLKNTSYCETSIYLPQSSPRDEINKTVLKYSETENIILFLFSCLIVASICMSQRFYTHCSEYELTTIHVIHCHSNRHACATEANFLIFQAFWSEIYKQLLSLWINLMWYFCTLKTELGTHLIIRSQEVRCVIPIGNFEAKPWNRVSNLGSKQESSTENQIFWCENKVRIEKKGLTPALNLSKTQMSFDAYLFDLYSINKTFYHCPSQVGSCWGQHLLGAVSGACGRPCYGPYPMDTLEPPTWLDPPNSHIDQKSVHDKNSLLVHWCVFLCAVLLHIKTGHLDNN